MPAPLPDLLRRQRALARVMTKYRGRPLDWAQADCVRMARTLLVAMGHRVPKLPRYATLPGAARALKATGHDSVEALLDGLLPRIAPAAMLPGDLALMEGDGAFDAIALCLGQKLWGWHQDNALAEPVVMTPRAVKAAYRT